MSESVFKICIRSLAAVLFGPRAIIYLFMFQYTDPTNNLLPIISLLLVDTKVFVLTLIYQTLWAYILECDFYRMWVIRNSINLNSIGNYADTLVRREFFENVTDRAVKTCTHTPKCDCSLWDDVLVTLGLNAAFKIRRHPKYKNMIGKPLDLTVEEARELAQYIGSSLSTTHTSLETSPDHDESVCDAQAMLDTIGDIPYPTLLFMSDFHHAKSRALTLASLVKEKLGPVSSVLPSIQGFISST